MEPMEPNSEGQSTATSSSDRPVARFTGSGGLGITVWKQKSADNERYSVFLDRSYQAPNGSYLTTNYIRDIDILRAGRLLQQVDDWIEHDKGHKRGKVTGNAR